MDGVNRNSDIVGSVYLQLYLVWELNLPKPEHRRGVNCSSSLLSLALPSLSTHSSGYTPGGDSYHFPINFLFRSSLHPLFSPLSHSQLHNLVFCALFEEIQSCIFPPTSFETLKSAVKEFFFFFPFAPHPSFSYPPPPTFSLVAVLPNLTSVFISPSSAGT